MVFIGGLESHPYGIARGAFASALAGKSPLGEMPMGIKIPAGD